MHKFTFLLLSLLFSMNAFCQKSDSLQMIIINKESSQQVSSIFMIPEVDLVNNVFDKNFFYMKLIVSDLIILDNNNIVYDKVTYGELVKVPDSGSSKSGGPNIVTCYAVGDLTVGEEIRVKLLGENNGSAASENYLTMSFPSISYISQSDCGDFAGWFDDVYAVNAGSQIWRCYGDQTTASYTLVDGYEETWNGGTDLGIWADVTPSNSGYFYAYCKLSMDNGTARDPSGGCQQPDQQRWPIYSFRWWISEPPLPDVDVWAMSTYPINPQVGDEVDLKVTLKNIGDATAYSPHIKYYIDNSYIDDDDMGNLSPDEEDNAQENNYIFNSAGSYEYKVIVDPVNDEVEITNNTQTMTVYVAPNNYPPNNPSFFTSGPSTLYPTKTYTITVDYTDPDGQSDLDNVYLRLAQNDNENSNRLTMMWGLGIIDNVYQWADETQALKNMDASKASITNGYRVTWEFEMDWNWFENSNVDYWAFSIDDAGVGSNHTKYNRNAYYENDIRINTSTENADPITEGDDYIVTGLVSFEGTTIAPEDWSGISVDMRKSTTSGTLLDTDNSVSSGYSVTWETIDGDDGNWDVYILPKNTYHQPPNNSSTYWDTEDIIVEQDLIATTFDITYFDDFQTNIGKPYLMEAKLIESSSGDPVSGVKIDFLANENGTWTLINDQNELAFQGGVTNEDGVAKCWYHPPNSGTNQTVRIEWNGNSTYNAATGQNRIASFDQALWSIMIYMAVEDPDHSNIRRSAYTEFKNMMKAGYHQEVNVYIIYDKYDSGPQNSNDWFGTRRFIPWNDKFDIDWSKPEDYLGHVMFHGSTGNPPNYVDKNMAQISTLDDFYTWASDICPTTYENFVFYGHGTGVFGFCHDGSNVMYVTELSDFLEDNNIDIDIIGYRSCSMSSIEVSMEISSNSNYFVGSQGYSLVAPDFVIWNTKNMVDEIILTTTPEDFTEIIVDNFAIWGAGGIYKTDIAGYNNNGDITQLNVKLTELFEYLKTDIWYNRASITYSINDALRITPELLWGFPGSEENGLDLRSLVSKFDYNSYLTVLSQDIVSDIDDIIVDQRENYLWGQPAGISIIHPHKENSNAIFYWDYYFDYLAPEDLIFNSTTSWYDFQIAYFDDLDTDNGSLPPTCSLDPISQDWIGGDLMLTAQASDPHTEGIDNSVGISSGVAYVEFDYSLNGTQWFDLISNNSEDGRDWYGDDGWGLMFNTISINDGSVWIRSRARDWGGNYSNWQLSDPISIDNLSPTGTIIINNGAPTTTFNIVSLNLTYNDNLSGVTHMQFSNDGSSWSDWQTSSNSINWNLFSYGGNTNFGMKTVYVKYKDAAQNESVVYNDQIEYITLPPALVTFAINNGAATTSSNTVTLNNSATNNPTHYMASESSNFNGASWYSYSTAPYFTLSSGYGMKTVYFKVKNSTGESNVISDNIEYVQNTQPPAISYFALNNGASTTTNSIVTLNNSATNSPTHYLASENSNFNGAFWNTYSTAPNFIISAGYGMKTVYFKVKNSAGNSSVLSDQIEYMDNTVPPTLLLQNITLNNGEIECYDATGTITVAGSGTTVDVMSGGSATFIAGERLELKPGFHSHSGSATHAYITTTSDYCSSLPPMVPESGIGTGEQLIDPELYVTDEVYINIYPNPTTGQFTIDFMGKITTADIMLVNFQGKQIIEYQCKEQLKMEIDIGQLPGGMYIIVIKSEDKIITRKIIKNY